MRIINVNSVVKLKKQVTSFYTFSRNFKLSCFLSHLMSNVFVNIVNAKLLKKTFIS